MKPIYILFALGNFFLSLCAIEGATERPNILLLLADDLGYRDLSCYGGDAVETPHLDQLALQGVRMTQFYSASAVCSPTRASVLTGRYPQRFGISTHFNDVDKFLPEEATTVAELLRDEGYRTFHAGKWHLGGLHVDEAGLRKPDQPGPRQHGFQHYQTQIEQQPLRGKMGTERRLFREGGTLLIRDDKRVPASDPYFEKHLTDANGDYTIEMIRQSHADGVPFFANVWWLVPHTPYEPAPEPHWGDSAPEPGEEISEDQRRFRSMMRHMDAKIGEILACLDELGIADNTIVIFTSDNGAAWEGNIGELKGGKTDLHDGGIRVPMIARWPGVVPAGMSTEVFGHTNDLLPTFLESAGLEISPKMPLDGRSLLPHLSGDEGTSPSEGETVFWQIKMYGLQRHYAKPTPHVTEAARRGNYKLLARNGVPVSLYDLKRNPQETENLLSQHPDLANELTSELRLWLQENDLQINELR